MRTALIALANDFLSAIVFLVIYLVTANLYVAAAASIAVATAQLVIFKLNRWPIDLMFWLGLGLVVVLGTATIITDDSRFMMAKPSIIHFAVGAVMLRRGWLLRYLPPIVKDNLPERLLIASGYAWAILMIALGLINLFVATHYSIEVWGWFISVGAIGAKVVAFLLQYAVFRVLLRRKLQRTAP
jgi:intracellular septation protein A